MAIYNYLANTKFEDPAQEAYRKRFVAEFPEVSKWVPAVHKAMATTRQGVRGQLQQGQ